MLVESGRLFYASAVAASTTHHQHHPRPPKTHEDPRVKLLAASICFKPHKYALSSPTPLAPLSAASAVLDDDDNSGSKNNNKKLRKKKSSSSWPVTLWVHLVSIFVLVNYYFCNNHSCWPAAMATRVSLSTWSLVHALSCSGTPYSDQCISAGGK